MSFFKPKISMLKQTGQSTRSVGDKIAQHQQRIEEQKTPAQITTQDLVNERSAQSQVIQPQVQEQPIVQQPQSVQNSIGVAKSMNRPRFSKISNILKGRI